jgi:hypothetical protein
MTTEEKSILDKAQDLAKDVAEKAKDVAVTAKEKVSTFVGEHEDQIHSGIEKTGGFVDDKTKGRFSEKIDKAQGVAKEAVSKIGGATTEDRPKAEEPKPAAPPPPTPPTTTTDESTPPGATPTTDDTSPPA